MRAILRATVVSVLVCGFVVAARADEFDYGYGSADIANTSGRFGISGSAGNYTLDFFRGSFAGVVYDVSTVGLGTYNGQVYLGGLLNGVNGLANYTNDFLEASQFTPGTLPSFSDSFYYSTTSTGTQRGTVNFTLTSVTPTIAPTPEPSSFVLLGTGLLGVVAAGRRRLS